MMLSKSAELVMKGKEALVRKGYHFDDVEDRTIGGSTFKVHLDLIELTDPARTEALAHARSLSLEKMTLAAEGSALQVSASGAKFRSLAKPWAYIGRISLHAGCILGAGWVAVDIRVAHGTVGVGVLNRKEDDFLVSGSAKIDKDSQTIVLPVNSFAEAGDFILREIGTRNPPRRRNSSCGSDRR